MYSFILIIVGFVSLGTWMWIYNCTKLNPYHYTWWLYIFNVLIITSSIYVCSYLFTVNRAHKDLKPVHDSSRDYSNTIVANVKKTS